GSTGMLGSECKEILSQEHEVIAPDKKELDIISWDRVIEKLQEVSPDVVLNCAGFNDVDACETEDFMVRKINVEGPRNLAQGSARFECKLVHISSDYVFDGQKMMPQPYFEDDTANPLSAYGKSKMESETAVRENSPNFIIVRTAWLYGINGKNFIKSIVSQGVQKKTNVLKVADDQFGSPTWTNTLALQIRELLRYDGRGTYHATAEGYCTRFECAKYVLDKLGIKVSIEPCSMKDYKGLAKRPANCLLENRLLKKQRINFMQNWKEDLNGFLEKYGEELIKEAKAP
ncbi:MAG: dTDP-4-dehydrorhamnose reductase, partial [Desulfobacteraceae bacterium]